MLSKNTKKFVSSLSQKKHRKQFNVFKAEGDKLNRDLLDAKAACTGLYATEQWIKNNNDLINPKNDITVCSEKEIKSISNLKSPPPVIGIYEMFNSEMNFKELSSNITLALDGIQDPGNMGTIVRIADWFGIKAIVCSDDTADIYNPKVVQATMGAITRVKVHYTVLAKFIDKFKNETNLPVYGTFLEGKSIYNEPLSKNALIVLGNEGKGISTKVEASVTQKLYIPNYPPGVPTSESLNVAIAGAIVCSEFRRRNILE